MWREFPPITATFIRPELHTKREFTIQTLQDAWAVISFLRGDTKFTQTGQLWAYIPEHSIWLVQYKNNCSDYGLRRTFINSTARKYRRDLLLDKVSK